MTINIRIAVIGECMVELRKINGALDQSFGGDTLNTAAYISRLVNDHNVETSYVTGLGKDPFSRDMLTAWQQEQINTDLVHISDKKTPGIYAIETAEDGERSFYYWRSESAAKYWLREYSVEELVSKLSPQDWIYLSGISLAILPQDCLHKLLDVIQICRENGTKIAFDNNYRSVLWESTQDAQKAYESILKLTDIAFLTYDDEVELWSDTDEQQAIDRTRKLGVEEIVVKRGANACYVATADNIEIVAANKVERVVDTTAAGDSFSAGYLAKRLTGGDLVQSAQAGHLLAGTVIQYPGAIIQLDCMPNI
ncbi:sugar kinase [Vibrio hannami]|uniref:sugar kinase n=1 Tax=Vibrio hannami TaxID=2717094 RepID=UPI00240EE787|nr:sugar kinase [Vibrio hannami]MDG3084848.1 sugar kinase [Vibrio hannami]